MWIDAELLANTDGQRQQAEEVGVGPQHHADGHCEEPEHILQMGSQSGRNDVDQHLGHGLHHTGLGQDAQEYAGSQQDHGHGQGSGSVHLDGTGLVFGGMEVGNQGYSQAEHEGSVQRNLGEAQQADDEQGQEAVEPDHLRTAHEGCIFSGQIIVSGFVFFVVRELGGFASGNQASPTAFFHHAHVGSEDHQDYQAHALEGNQFLP